MIWDLSFFFTWNYIITNVKCTNHVSWRTVFKFTYTVKLREPSSNTARSQIVRNTSTTTCHTFYPCCTCENSVLQEIAGAQSKNTLLLKTQQSGHIHGGRGMVDISGQVKSQKWRCKGEAVRSMIPLPLTRRVPADWRKNSVFFCFPRMLTHWRTRPANSK